MVKYEKYIINNVNVVTPIAILEQGAVVVSNGKIRKILHQSENGNDYNFPVLNGNNSYLLPGLIDIHTDALEKEIVPRPGADFPIDIAFYELERKMCGCGITTAFHSMHLGYESAENSSNSKYDRKELFEEVHKLSQSQNLINNLIHLRFELTGLYHYDLVLEMLKSGRISLLSVMDHTPGQGQFQPEVYLKKLMVDGKSEEEAQLQIKKAMLRERIQHHELENLIQTALYNKIPVASHDDDTPEKVRKLAEMGITICEFPINLETANEATNLGMDVIGGSANILRGGSLSGNLSVMDGIKERNIDCICSDYYPPSMLHSVFKIYKEGIMSLPESVKLATLNPAKAVKLDTEIGSIEEGKTADLILVELLNDRPTVAHTIVKGHLSAQHQYNLQAN